MIRIITTYRFECDWRFGCSDHLVVHGAETLVEAQARARREHWTFTRVGRGPRKATAVVRCPTHAYLLAYPIPGRPRKTA